VIAAAIEPEPSASPTRNLEERIMIAARAVPLVSTRGVRSPDDYQHVAAILATSRPVDGYDTVRTAGQLEAAFGTFLGFDPAEGVRIAEIDGQVVGFAYGAVDGDHPELGRIVIHSGSVLPRWRGIGIGRRLLAEAQAAAARQGARRPGPAPATTVLRSFVAETDHDARRLLEHDGHVIARYGYAMVRPTLADPPPVLLPDGIELRPARRSDLPAIGSALNEAFADHWGIASYSEAELNVFFDHPLYGQLDTWQVAWEGDRPVGGVLGFINEEENRILARRRGYTENIWTLRPWRGRGIATALIGANLRHLAARGMTEAALSVDTQNPTGAMSLYEKTGFVRSRTDLIYQRSVRTPGRV